MQTIARSADLGEIMRVLNEQHARKHDIVLPASAMSFRDGRLVVKGAEPDLSEHGVTVVDGDYRISDVFLTGLSGKFNIPLPYLRRMIEDRRDMFDANLNGWVAGRKAKSRLVRDADGTQRMEEVLAGIPGDARSFMLRLFSDPDDPIARAILSDRFRIFDNLDVALSVLAALIDAGLEDSVEIKADLSERRLYLYINAPQVTVYARQLLKGYRSPFSGVTGDELPLVSAGVAITNSEVGHGALNMVPLVTVLACANGMTLTREAVRKVHLGTKLEEGVVRWSDDTQEANLNLIKAQVRDSIKAFLDVSFMERVVAGLEEHSDKPVEDAAATIKTVGKQLSYTEEQQAGILGMFIKGGQMTAGGIMQAVTAYAQTVEDPDVVADLQGSAVQALTLV